MTKNATFVDHRCFLVGKARVTYIFLDPVSNNLSNIYSILFHKSMRYPIGINSVIIIVKLRNSLNKIVSVGKRAPTIILSIIEVKFANLVK